MSNTDHGPAKGHARDHEYTLTSDFTVTETSACYGAVYKSAQPFLYLLTMEILGKVINLAECHHLYL